MSKKKNRIIVGVLGICIILTCIGSFFGVRVIKSKRDEKVLNEFQSYLQKYDSSTRDYNLLSYVDTLNDLKKESYDIINNKKVDKVESNRENLENLKKKLIDENTILLNDKLEDIKSNIKISNEKESKRLESEYKIVELLIKDEKFIEAEEGLKSIESYIEDNETKEVKKELTKLSESIKNISKDKTEQIQIKLNKTKKLIEGKKINEAKTNLNALKVEIEKAIKESNKNKKQEKKSEEKPQGEDRKDKVEKPKEEKEDYSYLLDKIEIWNLVKKIKGEDNLNITWANLGDPPEEGIKYVKDSRAGKLLYFYQILILGENEKLDYNNKTIEYILIDAKTHERIPTTIEKFKEDLDKKNLIFIDKEWYS